MPLPGPLGRKLRELWVTALGSEMQMTKLLVGLNVLGFALMMLDAGPFAAELLAFGGGVPKSVFLRAGLLQPQVFEPWMILSAVFMHLGVLHIVFNMMATWRQGRVLEPFLGGARLAVAFVVCGGVGFLATLLIADASYPGTGGASGAVFGLFGLTIGIMRRIGNAAWKEALIELVIAAAIFAYVLPVNNTAHVAGFLTGFGLAYTFGRQRTPMGVQLLTGAAVVLIFASVGSLVAAQVSPLWKEVRVLEMSRGHWDR